MLDYFFQLCFDYQIGLDHELFTDDRFWILHRIRFEPCNLDGRNKKYTNSY